MDRNLALLSLGFLTLVGIAFTWSLSSQVPKPKSLESPTATTESAPPPSQVAVTPTAPHRLQATGAIATAAPMPDSTAALSEPELLARLRELKGTAPLLSLQLAREGNERFPDSASAAERTWHVVKSLSDLGRHDEARAEARKMLELFPNSRFTADVVRHTLSRPPSPNGP